MAKNSGNRISNLPLKSDRQFDKVRTSRFTSMEFLIVILVIVVIAAICFYITKGFIDDANKVANDANEKVLEIALYTTLASNDYTQKELDDFLKKYSEYKDVSLIINGTSIIEKEITSYLGAQTNNIGDLDDLEDVQQGNDPSKIPIKGKVKIEYKDNTLKVDLIE